MFSCVVRIGSLAVSCPEVWARMYGFFTSTNNTNKVTHPGTNGWELASCVLAPFVDLLMYGGRQTAKDCHGQSGDLRWPVAPDTQHLPISLQGSLVDGARSVAGRLYRVEETWPERKRFQCGSRYSRDICPSSNTAFQANQITDDFSKFQDNYFSIFLV